MPLYNRDLAEIHDEGFGAFAADAAPGLLRRLRHAGIHEGLVVDLGCGSGIWARTLTDAGYEVLGVDRSEAMLEIARRRAPRAEFVHASVLDFVPPVCAAVTAVGEVFCYAGSLAPLHGIAGAHLILFDVATPARARTAGRSFHDGDGWVLCNEVTCDGSTLTRRITTFTRHGDAWRRADEDHALRLFEPTHVLAELRATGYEGHRLRSYGRELRPSPGLAFFAATPR
ncbi:MAG TPA: class I SAM-dependent methyltransferase [Solirubrobacteraceae bacterium]|nr:class I SAM-dependent methyltransferase [Solirubrobacteraceae bacterium]